MLALTALSCSELSRLLTVASTIMKQVQAPAPRSETS